MPHVEVERTITASSVVSRPGYDERLGGLSFRALAVRPLQVSAMHTMSHDFH
jgi:hypothetical protein